MPYMNIKELGEKANEVGNDRVETRDRRERAIGAAAVARKSLSSIQDSLNRLEDGAESSERMRLLSRQQELQFAYLEAIKEAEDCDRRIELLDDAADEVVSQAEEYIERSNGQVRKTYEARASSPYGRGSIAVLARLISANKDKAQQIIMLLKGKAPSAGGEGLVLSSSADQYIQEYKDLVSVAAFGSIRGVEGEPSNEDRRQSVLFVNDAYSYEIARVGTNVSGFTPDDVRQALVVLQGALDDTGAECLWDPNVPPPEANGFQDPYASPSLQAARARIDACAALMTAFAQEEEGAGRQKSIGQHSLYPTKGFSSQLDYEADQAKLVAAYGDAANAFFEIVNDPEIDAETKARTALGFERCREGFRYYFIVPESTQRHDASQLAHAIEVERAYDRVLEKGLPLVSNAFNNCFSEVKCINTGAVRNVDFADYDCRVSSLFVDALREAKADFPELDIKYIGSIESQVSGIRAVAEERCESMLRERNTGFSDEQYKEKAKGMAESILRNMRLDDSADAYAWSFNSQGSELHDAISHYSGIAVSRRFASNYDTFDIAHKQDVPNHSPLFCDTPRSTIDHEIGHEISNSLGVWKDPAILRLYENMLSRGSASTELSLYSTKNVHEFIAEAYSEYRNNPDPRSLSKAVCERLFYLRDSRRPQ